MSRKVGGFALISSVSDQADYYNMGDNGALVPIALGKELDWLLAQVDSTPGVKQTGLLKSWKIPPADPEYNQHLDECIVHEQALASIAALAGFKAPTSKDVLAIETFIKGLIYCFKTNGEVTYSINRITLEPIIPYYRTSSQAWALYALALYCHLYPQGIHTFYAKELLLKGIPKLLQYQMSSVSASPMKGLITAGRGSKVGSSYDDLILNYSILDDNVVAWLAIHTGQVVLGSLFPGLEALSQNIFNFWDISSYRYKIDNSGLDTRLDTLSTHLYGGIWSFIQKDLYRANLCLSNMTPYKYFEKIQGFVPVLEERGFPGIKKRVWSAGTFGYANLARKVVGNATCDLAIASIGPLRDDTGGWSGTLDPDNDHFVGMWPCVRSTAHAILAMHLDMRDIFVTPVTGTSSSSKFVDPAFVEPAFVE